MYYDGWQPYEYEDGLAYDGMFNPYFDGFNPWNRRGFRRRGFFPRRRFRFNRGFW